MPLKQESGPGRVKLTHPHAASGQQKAKSGRPEAFWAPLLQTSQQLHAGVLRGDHCGAAPLLRGDPQERHLCNKSTHVQSGLRTGLLATRPAGRPSTQSAQLTEGGQEPAAQSYLSGMGKLAKQTNGCQVAQLFQTQINSREASARLPSHPDTVKCLGKTPFNWEGADPITQPSW